MDSILYWNDVALEANRVSHTNGAGEQTGPVLSARALAIVHLAMYDAYAGVANHPEKLPLYLAGPALPPSGASSPAAVAAAAHTTLSALFPSQRAFFDAKFLQVGLGGAGIPDGHDYGVRVAQAILDDRRNDPAVGDAGYVPSLRRGAHRADPDAPGQRYHAPFYGKNSRCFAVRQRHELNAPPALGSAEYVKALREVRGKGIAPELAGTLPKTLDFRTPDQTVIGLFWGYDGSSGLGTPPRLYNQIVRKVAQAQGNDEAKNAQLFAFVNAAMADAGILAWEAKYKYELWRPVLGIREHDTSMGPGGAGGSALDQDCDPSWLPLGAPNSNSSGKNTTPPFPAYPSGHATFGAAALHVTRLFYKVPLKDRKADSLFDGLEFVSDELNGVTTDNKGTVRPRHVRTFPKGLMQMIEENGRSRVYLGVHWVFDAFAEKGGEPDYDTNVGGVLLGLNVAEDIYQFGSNGLGPKKSTA